MAGDTLRAEEEKLLVDKLKFDHQRVRRRVYTIVALYINIEWLSNAA